MNESALDFVEGFKKLLEENRIEQAKTDRLREEQQQLTKEIETLAKKRTSILTDIDKHKQDTLVEIERGRLNADRIFKQENTRLELQNRLQQETATYQKATEDKQRQKENELLAKEEALNEREKKLVCREVDANIKETKLNEIGENQIVTEAKNKSVLERIAQETKNLKIEKEDIKTSMAYLKDAQIKAQQEQDKIKVLTQENEKVLKEIEAEQKKLEKKQIEVGKQLQELDVRITVADKKQKDLNDKEKTLQAMKVEIDFKLAKIESAKK